MYKRIMSALIVVVCLFGVYLLANSMPQKEKTQTEASPSVSIPNGSVNEAAARDKKIQNGGGGMPSFKGKLSDEQIAALAAWLAAQTVCSEI